MAHGNDWAEPRWREYRKHLPPNSRVKRWSQVVRETDEPRHKGYYHPDLLGKIEELEMSCLEAGRLISEIYPTRYYWSKADFVVGASRGEETCYLLVEHHASSGDLHGHPVTKDELRKKGVSDESLDS